MTTLSIPAFHVSDASQVKGVGEVFIQSRKSGPNLGVFNVEISASFDPTTSPYPIGSLIITVDLSDSAKGTFKATTIELINSYGRHNPTVYLTGQCGENLADVQGCRYWLMIANNKSPNQDGTPDIVGFAIHDRNGQRIAYGTGPVRRGDFEVAPI